MKVFLGGTCPGWDWRKELIPMLQCDYYNPIVEDWGEKYRLREVYEREICDYVLYVITEDMEGVYSIAEVVDDSNKKPAKTLFCNFNTNPSLNIVSVEKMLKSNGVNIFYSLKENCGL